MAWFWLKNQNSCYALSSVIPTKIKKSHLHLKLMIGENNVCVESHSAVVHDQNTTKLQTWPHIDAVMWVRSNFGTRLDCISIFGSTQPILTLLLNIGWIAMWPCWGGVVLQSAVRRDGQNFSLLPNMSKKILVKFFFTRIFFLTFQRLASDRPFAVEKRKYWLSTMFAGHGKCCTNEYRN